MVTKRDLSPYMAIVMVGPEPPDDFECDGCTMAPDKIGAVDVRPACLWHDWAYTQGGREHDRERADRNFYHNLRRCGLGRIVAHAYYFRVRLWGCRHFHYIYQSEKPGWLKRLWLLLSRYIEF